MKSFFMFLFLMLSVTNIISQNNDSVVVSTGPSIIYPLTHDKYIEERKNAGRNCYFVYPLLILNNIIIREEEQVNCFRNRYERAHIKSIKLITKEEAEKKGIPNAPKDGVLLITTKKGYYFDFSCKQIIPIKDGGTKHKEIKNYLDLALRFSSDTIKYGDTLTVNMEFSNKTDSTLTFYPRAVCFLAKPNVGFEYESYTLTNYVDATWSVQIKPKSMYTYAFMIHVQRPFFVNGQNHLTLVYVCPELKGKDAIYNTQCGSLESKQVKLFIAP